MAQLTFMDKLDEEQLLNAEKVALKAKALGIDPKFAVAIAYHESGLRTNPSIGADGEVGMMQVKPDTAKLVKFKPEDLKDPSKNIDAGLAYLKSALDATGNDHKLATIGYNAGINHEFFSGGSLPPSTKAYLKDMKSYGAFDTPSQITEPKDPNLNYPSSQELAQLELEKQLQDKKDNADMQRTLGGFYGAGAGGTLGLGAQAGQGIRSLMPNVLSKVGATIAQNIPQTTYNAPTGGLPSASTPSTPSAQQGLQGSGLAPNEPVGGKGTYNYGKNTINLNEWDLRNATDYGDVWKRNKDYQEFMQRFPRATQIPGSDFMYEPTIGSGPRGSQAIHPNAPFPRDKSGLDAVKSLLLNMAEMSPEMKLLAERAGRVISKVPIVSAPLAGYSIGRDVADINTNLNEANVDIPDTLLTGAGALGTAMSLHPLTAPIGVPLSITAPIARDVRRTYKDIEKAPESYKKPVESLLTNLDPMGNFTGQ